MAVIGTCSWKSRGFRRIVNYINQEKNEDDRQFPPIYWNILKSTPEAAIKAFCDIEQGRLVDRKNSVRVFHDWVSLSVEDSKHITPAILEDLAYKYIELRSNGQMLVCFAKAHLHNQNLHVHFAFSGVDLHGKAIRLSNDDFKRIRLEHERYQVEKYPELTHSVVYISKERFRMRGKEAARKAKGEQREFRRKMRTQAKSHKEMLHDQVLDVLSQSDSWKSFIQRLQNHNLGIYYRSGRLEGIRYKKRKYRFKTLNLDTETLRHIETHQRDQALYAKKVQELRRMQGRMSPKRSRA